MNQVIFESGATFTLLGAQGALKVVHGAKRDVLTVTVSGTYAAVMQEVSAEQTWAIVQDEEVFDKSAYTLLVSVTDTLDGNITFVMAQGDTLEQQQAAEIAEMQTYLEELGVDANA